MNKLTNITIVLFSILTLSCVNTKQQKVKTPKQSNMPQKMEIRSKFNLSPYAQFFINDLNTELKSKNIIIEEYLPSKELIEKYPIQLFNNVYFIQGFITYNNEFNESQLEQYNITVGRALGNKRSINIPISTLNIFLKMKGIEHFEMNPKSNLK